MGKKKKPEKGKVEKVDNPENAEKVEKVDKAEKAEKVKKEEQVDESEKVEKAEKAEKVKKAKKFKIVDEAEKAEKVKKAKKVEKEDEAEKAKKAVIAEQGKKTEKAEKAENEFLEKIFKGEEIIQENSLWDKIKAFFTVHYRGVVCIVAPFIMLAFLVPFPPAKHQWCAYTLGVMALYWLSECIPLEITSFIPVFIFPMTDVMTTSAICKCYVNDIIILLFGIMLLSFALEQTHLFKRLIYACMPLATASHIAMFAVVYELTLLISVFIPNTTATKTMTPIVLNMLESFEKEGGSKVYETNKKGEKVATDLATGYCCGITYAASLGGLIFLISTSTNLAFKGLYQKMSTFPGDELPFIHFMIASFVPAFFSAQFSLVYLLIMFFGVIGDKNKAAKNAVIPVDAGHSFQVSLKNEATKLGSFTMAEVVVVICFSIALMAFAFRYPIYFKGLNYLHAKYYGLLDAEYFQDSALAFIVCFILFLIPGSIINIKTNFTAKVHEELPKRSCPSALDWATANSEIPLRFIFVLGGGFALVDAGQASGLYGKITNLWSFMRNASPGIGIFLVMVIVIILTNIGPNVAVANLMCPIAMLLAGRMFVSQLWFCMAAGYAASFAFLLPTGCPGNLFVYHAAKIPVLKMIKAGIGPTIITFIVFYLWILFVLPPLFGFAPSIIINQQSIIFPSGVKVT